VQHAVTLSPEPEGCIIPAQERGVGSMRVHVQYRLLQRHDCSMWAPKSATCKSSSANLCIASLNVFITKPCSCVMNMCPHMKALCWHVFLPLPQPLVTTHSMLPPPGMACYTRQLK
jgi:hypothetical protein